MDLVFATHNHHKIKEVQTLVPEKINLLSLGDIHCNEEIPETAVTLEGNAKLKARHVFENYDYNCFADDTGLEVYALDGKPGVYSSRYAGNHANDADNINKLLNAIKNSADRTARFRTVICLIIAGKEYVFEGICEGEIIEKKRGTNGFGYDPVFRPKGYDKTFAELSLNEKNKVSHRAKAIRKLIGFLNDV